jgi:DNA adenine methylase
MSKSTRDMLASVERLGELHERLQCVVMYNEDALKLIPRYDKPQTLIYLDPPYAHETRTNARYPVDMDDTKQQELIRLLKAIQSAYVVLSGYDNPLYATLLASSQWSKTIIAVGGNGKEECVWTNYESAVIDLSTPTLL